MPPVLQLDGHQFIRLHSCILPSLTHIDSDLESVIRRQMAEVGMLKQLIEEE